MAFKFLFGDKKPKPVEKEPTQLSDQDYCFFFLNVVAFVWKGSKNPLGKILGTEESRPLESK
jgi:hypothetical protein